MINSNINKLFVSGLFFLFLLMVKNSSACTNFQLKADDNSVIVARTMEFAVELNSKVIVRPRNLARYSITPDNKKAHAWKTKYGYIAADSINLDVAVDGFNEKGLSVGMLWFPGSKYENTKAAPDKDTIEIMDFSNWLLSSFNSVDEVRKNLDNLKVWSKYRDEVKIEPQIHYAIHDQTGDAIVVEFINGKKIVHDNKVGVLTNAPSFDWHMNNLRNFAHVTPTGSHENNIFNGQLKPNMIGSSLIGIPNDMTPASRFVRAVALINLAEKPKNINPSVTTAEHILNAIDIPKGIMEDKVAKQAFDEVCNYTQWVTIKDLTNKHFYFKSYEDQTLRKIDLTKFDLNSKDTLAKSLPMRGGVGIVEVTNEF